jgi:hypothetical protein
MGESTYRRVVSVERKSSLPDKGPKLKEDEP